MSDKVDWIDAEAEELDDRLGDQEIRTVSANDLETMRGDQGSYRKICRSVKIPTRMRVKIPGQSQKTRREWGPLTSDEYHDTGAAAADLSRESGSDAAASNTLNEAKKKKKKTGVLLRIAHGQTR